MIYNIDKTKEYLLERIENAQTSININTIYKALNNGGLSYTSLCNIEDGSERNWSDETSLDDFYVFWGSVFSTEKALGKITTNICIGDILVEYQSTDKTESIGLMYVLDIKEKNNGIQIYEVLRVLQRKPGAKVCCVKRTDIADKTNLLQFSKIAYNLSNYYNLIFKSLLNSQALFVKMIISCCPEKKKSDERKTCDSLFSVVSCKELQDAIECAVFNGTYKIDLSSSIVESFVKVLFFKDQPERDELIDKINRISSGKIVSLDKGTGKDKDKVISRPTVNKFLHGESPNKPIDAFFKNKSNRILFQARFSLVLQFYFLLSGKVNTTQWCSINDSFPITFGNESISATEYITLSASVVDKITKTVRYFSNHFLDTDRIYIDSLFSLSGCIFDSISFSFEDNQLSTYKEFGRFRELAKCYGARTLDYFFALKRNASVNHFAASELANVYYFGWEFEGYKIEKNTEEAMKLLNSCKDFSVDSRWSLGENYKRLADRYLRWINNYSTSESISEEKQLFSVSGKFTIEFQECLQICNIDNESVFNYSNEYITTTINDRLTNIRDKAIENSRSLYLGCGDYPPALNSLANVIKNSLYELIKEKETPQIICRLATDVIGYYVKAASSGWVYSFNNLYSMLSDSSIMNILDSCAAGRKAVKSAYSILKNVSITSSNIAGEEQFDIQKQKLIIGTSKELTSYQGTKYDILFKYIEPLEKPINFLVVSAFFDNLYGMNHLGVEYINIGTPYYCELAKEIFECAAVYGPWGHYNLSKYIYPDDEENKIYHLKMASDMGLQEAVDALARQRKTTRGR